MREYALRSGIGLGSILSRQEAAIICKCGVRKRFAAGSVLHRQDEAADSLHLLLTGSVKTFLVHADGQQSVLRIHLAGSLIGLSALSSRACWDANSVALRPSTAISVRREKFLHLLEGNPALGVKLINLLLDRLSDLHFRVTELQTQGVERRLAHALLSLSRADPDSTEQGPCPILLTHEELAQLINTRRQTVTTILGGFSEAGWIARHVRRIEVVKPAALSAFCSDG